jgi:hypothetical protein
MLLKLKYPSRVRMGIINQDILKLAEKKSINSFYSVAVAGLPGVVPSVKAL